MMSQYNNGLYYQIIEIINSKFSKFFSVKGIIDYIISEKYNQPLRAVVLGGKRISNPWTEEIRQLRLKVLRVLNTLEKQELITKYSKITWRKVNGNL